MLAGLGGPEVFCVCFCFCFGHVAYARSGLTRSTGGVRMPILCAFSLRHLAGRYLPVVWWLSLHRWSLPALGDCHTWRVPGSGFRLGGLGCNVVPMNARRGAPTTGLLVTVPLITRRTKSSRRRAISQPSPVCVSAAGQEAAAGTASEGAPGRSCQPPQASALHECLAPCRTLQYSIPQIPYPVHSMQQALHSVWK